MSYDYTSERIPAEVPINKRDPLSNEAYLSDSGSGSDQVNVGLECLSVYEFNVITYHQYLIVNKSLF